MVSQCFSQQRHNMACSPCLAFRSSCVTCTLRHAQKYGVQGPKHRPMHVTTATDPDKQAGPMGTKPVAFEASAHGNSNWLPNLGTLFSFGALNGTMLDGIHSRVGLQIYDLGAINLGGLQTSLAVPPLLGVFYMVLGSLVLLSDKLLPGEATRKAQQRAQDVPYVALSFGLLAANLQLSAWLYSTGAPFNQILLALSAVCAVNWWLLDGTIQGLALSVLCAVGAPAAELLLLQVVPLWHYPHGDILNGAFVSWVPCCYFFYVPAVAALARNLQGPGSLTPPAEQQQQ